MKEKCLQRPSSKKKMLFTSLCLVIVQFFFSTTFVHAQGIKITGKVTDATSGDALPGTAVTVKGTTAGVITDGNGVYSIVAPAENVVLVFSSIGYVSKEVATGGKNEISISLESDIKTLNDVVVVGYGIQKKVSVTASISTITTKELVQTPVANISNALVGRLSGVTALQQSGEPGFDQSRIKIRGIGTLREGAESDPLIIVDGIQRESFNTLDPNEIESLSVLKDASATAVFGVRGANGVIIITTKTGKKGKPQISFSANFGTQAPTKLPEMLSSAQYATLNNEARTNDGKLPLFTDEDIALYESGTDPVFHPNSNWYDIMLKPSTTQQRYNFNISGGTDITRYFVSLGYFDQDGAYKYEDYNPEFRTNAKYKRYNLRSNFDIDFTKNFQASVKVGGQFSNSNYPGESTGTLFFRVLQANPLTPSLYDGKLIGSVSGSTVNAGATNPLRNLLGTGYRDNFDNNMNISVALKHKLDFITEGLLIRGSVAYDNYYAHNVTRSKSYTSYLAVKNPDDPTNPILLKQGDDLPFSFSEGFSRWRKIYGEAAIDYSRTFGDHTVTGLLLWNMSKYHAPGLEYNVPLGYLGTVGRVTYNFKSKYLAEFNMGYNGSENFPKGKRYGFFPAYSLGWVATNESFIPKNDILTFLKIRGSYGEVGNDKIGGARFLYLPSVFSYGGGYNFGEVGTNYNWYSGSYEGRIGNPDVTWERSKKFNIGAEINFFKDKLSFVGDYFEENRDDILWELGTVPAIVQATLPPANIGKVNNKGFELEGNYNNHLGKFNYWLKGNYSFAKNKIVYMDEPERDYPYMMQTGHSVGQYFGYHFDGFYNTEEELANRLTGPTGETLQLGDMRYKDLNDDGKLDDKDMSPIGYSQFPQITYGLSFGGEYKGFDFSVLFQGAARASVYLDQTAAWPFFNEWGNAQSFILGRWTQERYDAGEKITYPRLYTSPNDGMNNTVTSDFWLHNANYLRLKNLEIGYRFATKALSKVGVKTLRVYANGSNLITWSHMDSYDPEAPKGRGNYYPQMRIYNFGVNFQF